MVASGPLAEPLSIQAGTYPKVPISLAVKNHDITEEEPKKNFTESSNLGSG